MAGFPRLSCKLAVLALVAIAAFCCDSADAYRRRYRRSRRFTLRQAAILQQWRQTQARPLAEAETLSRAMENFAVSESRCFTEESQRATFYDYVVSDHAVSAVKARTACPAGYELAKPKSSLESKAAWKAAAGSAPATSGESCFNYTFGTSPLDGIDGEAAAVTADAYACQKRCQTHNAAVAAGNASTPCAYFSYDPLANGGEGLCHITGSSALYINDINHVVSGPPQCADPQSCVTLSRGQEPLNGIRREGRTFTRTWLQCQARCAALGVNETNRNQTWWNASWSLQFNGDFSTMTNAAGHNCTNKTAFPDGCEVATACTHFSWWPDGGCHVTANTTYYDGIVWTRNATVTVQSTASGVGAYMVTGPATCVEYNDQDGAVVGNTTYSDANGNVIPYKGLGASITNTWPQVSLGGRFLWIGAQFDASTSQWKWDDGQVMNSLAVTSAQTDRYCTNGINDTTSTYCCAASCGACVEDATCRLRPGGESQCCPRSIRSTRLCRNFPAPCVLDGASETQTPFEFWADNQGNRWNTSLGASARALEPYAALNRYTGAWHDFPGAAVGGDGFVLHTLCQRRVVRTRAQSSITSSIPLGEMNFDATSERPPDSRESATGLVPYGQCQAEFAGDTGDESVTCRGHCFHTTGSRGTLAMRGQYLEIEFATPRNITGFGIRGLASGSMWGYVWQATFEHSMDNVTYERVDSNRRFTFAHRGEQRMTGACDAPIRRRNFNEPVVAKFLRFFPLRWRHNPALRVTVYGCDANITHGQFDVLTPSDVSFSLDATSCSTVAGTRYTDTAVTRTVASVANASACCAACGATVGCYSWSYATATQACSLRSSPLGGGGVADAGYVSGNRPRAQGKTTCDLGWTGKMCEKRDLYRPSTGLQLPAYSRNNIAATSPTDQYAASSHSMLNLECTGGQVLTHNPSFLAAEGGALDRRACEILCTNDPRCVAFSWRSHFECYTYATCPTQGAIVGRGSWTGYLYVKLNMTERLTLTNSSVWQPFMVGSSLLFGEGSSHWSAINASGTVGAQAAVDGRRTHGNATSGLWYNDQPWSGEDFIEIPLNTTGGVDTQIASVTVWNYCVSPGTLYNNEGASVSIKLANGSYFFCGTVGQMVPCNFYTVACDPGPAVFATAVRVSSWDNESRLALAEVEAFDPLSSACEASYYDGTGTGLVADRTAAAACPAVTQLTGGCTSTEVGCLCGKEAACSASSPCLCQGEACVDGACRPAWLATEGCEVPKDGSGVPQTSLLHTVFHFFTDFNEGELPPLLAAEDIRAATDLCEANCTFRCCQVDLTYKTFGQSTRRTVRCSGANATGTVYKEDSTAMYRPHLIGQADGYTPCFDNNECYSGYCDRVTDPRPGQGVCSPPPAAVQLAQADVNANGDVRIVGGPNRYSGRVEVWIEKPAGAAPSAPPPQWATVCDDNWDAREAEVVCHRAGFEPKGAIAYKRAYFGEGSVPIGLDNLACVGNESSLLSCPRFGGTALYASNCQHDEDASVQCPEPNGVNVSQFGFSLKNGTTDTTALGWGRVEILAPLLSLSGDQARDRSNWVNQTVCDDGFTDDDAAVVCRSIGLYGGYAVPNIVFDGSVIRNWYGGPGFDNQTIMLDDLACDGTEDSLLNCSHNGREVSDCAHWEDAAVVCIVDSPFNKTDAPTGAAFASFARVTSAPTYAPTFAGDEGTFSCSATSAAVPATTQGCDAGWTEADVVWREDFNSGFGTATYDPYYNANPLRHLSFPLHSGVDFAAGSYWVRISWNSPANSTPATCEHVTFYVPAGSHIFNSTVQKNVAVTNVTYSGGGGGGVSSNKMASIFGSTSPSTASFCHACVGTDVDYRPGGTCWALSPSNDTKRECGCSGAGWAGSGIYYGGFSNGTQTQCDGWSGGFAGPKANLERKGGLPSVGLTISVQKTCLSDAPTAAPTAAPTIPGAPTTAAPTPLGCARAFAQCGGQGFSGPTACVLDFYCRFTHVYYAECTPSYPAGSSGGMWSFCTSDADCSGTMYCDDWDNYYNVTQVYYPNRPSPTMTCQAVPVCPGPSATVVAPPTTAVPTPAPTSPTAAPSTLSPTSASPTSAPTTLAPTTAPTTPAPSSAAPTAQPSVTLCAGHPSDPANCSQFLQNCADPAVRIVCPITCNTCTSAPTDPSWTYSPTAPTTAPTNTVRHRRQVNAPTALPTSPMPTRPPTRNPTNVPTLAPTNAPTVATSTTVTQTTVTTSTVTSSTRTGSSTTTRTVTTSTTTSTTTVSAAPTMPPTFAPSDAPTNAPTHGPTNAPTNAPTRAPTSSAPTGAPTAPTNAPTAGPTNAPTFNPTLGPTVPGASRTTITRTSSTTTATPTTLTSTQTSTSSVSSTLTTATTVTSVTTSTRTATTATTVPCDVWYGNILDGSFGNCSLGQFLDDSRHGTGAALCQACPSGTYMDEEHHQHLSCKSYDESLCAAGYYLVEERSISSDRLCAPCGGNDLGSGGTGSLTTYQPSNGYTGTSCFVVSTCDRGYYAAQTPTDSRNRECLPCSAGTYQGESSYIGETCTPCSSGTYSGEGAWACTAHKTCTLDEHTLSVGSAASNTHCVSCQEGQYFVQGGSQLDTFSSLGPDTSCGGTGVVFTDQSANKSWPYTATTSGDFEDCLTMCASDANCTAYEEVKDELLCIFYGHETITSEVDANSECFVRDMSVTSCQPCPNGTFQELTKHVKPFCNNVTKCQRGEYMVSTAWPDQNQVCAACPAGLYQDSTDHTFDSCKIPTVCQSFGVSEIASHTITTDTLCDTAAAARGIGDDNGANMGLALILILAIVTCCICYGLYRHYGGGAVAKAKREARLKKLKEAKICEGREPDDESDSDSDEEDMLLMAGVAGGAGTGGAITRAPTLVNQEKPKYEHGTVEPRHIEGARVKFLDKLGEGAFGAVYLGFYDSPEDDDGNIGGAYNVAVKVLKQGALTQKQLDMMPRDEIIAELRKLDDANVPSVALDNDEAGYAADTDDLAKKSAAAAPRRRVPYKKMHRDELVEQLLARSKMVHGQLKGNALSKQQLQDDSQWSVEDIRAELVELDRELQEARYKGLDHDGLVAAVLGKQEGGLVLEGNEYNEAQLSRMNRGELLQLLSDMDAKELRIKTYEAFDKQRLVQAYNQRGYGTLTPSQLKSLDAPAIRDLLVRLDDEHRDDAASPDEEIGTAPLNGVYDEMGKTELIQNVLERQQQVADAEWDAQMKEAYRDFWWEARTMAALSAGRGQYRIKYGKMSRRELIEEAAQRDAQQEERNRIKKGYVPRVDPDLPAGADGRHARVVMSKAEKKQWIAQRKEEWSTKPADGGMTEHQLTDFLLTLDDREGRLVGHANIAKIIGVVVDEKPTQVLLQLAEGGELKQFLEVHNPATSYKTLDASALITMTHDICSGMAYLESEGWIHGDLACRNVLINALQVCQVADFGLTKYQGIDIENNGRDENGRHTGRVALKEKKLKYLKYSTQYPVRWCPPEVIMPGRDRKPKRHFSHKSDVWAFGVTCYEIFTSAETPYSRVTDPLYTSDGDVMRNNDVKRFVCDGERLSCPPECDESFFNEVVAPCWEERPGKRPSFAVLAEKIAHHLKMALKDYKMSRVRFRTHMRNRVTVRRESNDYTEASGEARYSVAQDMYARGSHTRGGGGSTAYGGADPYSDAAGGGAGGHANPYEAASNPMHASGRRPAGGEAPYDFGRGGGGGGAAPSERPYEAAQNPAYSEAPYEAASKPVLAAGRPGGKPAGESPYAAASGAVTGRAKRGGGAGVENPYAAADAAGGESPYAAAAGGGPVAEAPHSTSSDVATENPYDAAVNK